MVNEWGVFGVVAALVAFLVAIGTPVIKLNTTINILIGKIEMFAQVLAELKEDNKKSHENIWDRLNQHTSQIATMSSEIEVIKARGDIE